MLPQSRRTHRSRQNAPYQKRKGHPGRGEGRRIRKPVRKCSLNFLSFENQESAYLKQLASERSSQADLRKLFIGTWRLVTIDGGAAANTTNRGTRPTGLICYDATGHMGAQIQPDRDRPRYTGTPTPQQAYDRMRGYTAYFGTYTVDEKAGIKIPCGQ